MAEVTLPQLGETVTEGTITQWFKQVGDTVAADEPLFEVSTDKVDTEVPSPVAGTLTEIRVPEGETVDVGTVIAVVGDGDGAPPASRRRRPRKRRRRRPRRRRRRRHRPTTAPAAEEPEQGGATEAPATETPADEPEAEPVEAAAEAPAPEPEPAQPRRRRRAAKGVLLSPVVRRLVNEHGLDPAADQRQRPRRAHHPRRRPRPHRQGRRDAHGADGRAGRGRRGSGREGEPAPAAKAAPAAAPAPAATKPAAAPTVAAGRARRDDPADQDPQAHRRAHADEQGRQPARLQRRRGRLRQRRRDPRGRSRTSGRRPDGFSLTYLPFISRATIDALAEFPHLNASVGENDLVVHRFVDLGIAVDLDYEGLIVPVIRDAEDQRLRAIARDINDLADRARTKKLMPDEISGGTFTISNNGSAGSVLTMPIINQPQVAILSTDAITRKPVVVPTTDGGEAIAIHPVGNLAMAWDHRAFDGAYAAGFLRRIKEILETRGLVGRGLSVRELHGTV